VSGADSPPSPILACCIQPSFPLADEKTLPFYFAGSSPITLFLGAARVRLKVPLMEMVVLFLFFNDPSIPLSILIVVVLHFPSPNAPNDNSHFDDEVSLSSLCRHKFFFSDRCVGRRSIASGFCLGHHGNDFKRGSCFFLFFLARSPKVRVPQSCWRPALFRNCFFFLFFFGTVVQVKLTMLNRFQPAFPLFLASHRGFPFL